MILYIDVSHCNLRCSTCPVGDVRAIRKSETGMMSVDLFKDIADKIVAENIKIDAFYIGNWGEALLNPDVWKIIRYAKQVLNPQQILVNSNFSLTIKEPELLLTSGITDLRISVSGMTQEVYERNHKGGNIERILENIKIVSAIKKELHIDLPKIAMVYHQYLYNQAQNEDAIKFCAEQGIDFMPIRCYVCTVEEGAKFHASEEVRKSYSEYIDLDYELSQMRTIPDEQPCALINQIVINHNGTAFKCCGTYTNKNSLGSFFDWKVQDLLDYYPPLCTICKAMPLSFR